MKEKTQFEMEAPPSDTRDKEEVETPISSSIEGKLTMTPKYQLAHDRVKMEIIPPQRYN